MGSDLLGMGAAQGERKRGNINTRTHGGICAGGSRLDGRLPAERSVINCTQQVAEESRKNTTNKEKTDERKSKYVPITLHHHINHVYTNKQQPIPLCSGSPSITDPDDT